MIFILGGILTGAKQVWHYVASAVKSGIEKTSALAQTIAGGIEISEDVYTQSYGLYEKSVAAWQKISQLNFDELIEQALSVESPFDWREKHIMQMRVQGRHPKTNVLVDKWITVESPTELTKGEWLTAGQGAIDETIGSDPTVIDHVPEFEYYVKPTVKK